MAVNSKSSKLRSAKNQLREAAGTYETRVEKYLRFPEAQDNILKNYESVTYRISIGAIDKRSFNDASYVDSDGQDPRWIVLGESGYTGTKETGEKSGSSGDIGSRSPAGGKNIPEYFIDGFNFLTNMPGSDSTKGGNTGMAGGSFDVFEPYSLGQWFESLMSSAKLSGYNHFIQTPFIVRIDFLGWQNGTSTNIDGARRFIPILLQNITFKADGSGSNYTVTFMQAGDAMSLNDFNIDVGSQVSFPAGRSPLIALFNLEKAMNTKEQELIKERKVKTLADEYQIRLVNYNFTDTEEISWPENPEWETFLSDPAKLKGVGGLETDNLIFGNNTTPNSKNNKLLDARFVYNSTTEKRLDLLTVITDVMCHTTVGTRAAQEADEDGDTIYFTVEKRAEFLDPEGPVDPLTGKFPKKLIYTVKPFKKKLDQIKQSTTEVQMTEKTTEVIRKVYSYLYTGENDDIIDYNLEFNAAFFLAGNHASFETLAERQSNTLAKGEYTWVKPVQGRSDVFSFLAPGAYPTEPDKKSFPAVPGGLGIDAAELSVARWVAANVTGQTNKEDDADNLYQIQLKLKILGDPYFIPTGGLGNQTYLPSSMAWEGHEIRVYVRFRTIQDYPYPGSNLPIAPDAGIDHPFSGVYRALLIRNNFEEGVFTQNLTLIKDLTVDPEILNTGAQSAAAGRTQSLLGSDFQSRSDLGTYTVKNMYKKGGSE